MGEKLEEILNRFKDKKILIVGDIMLDKYIEGDVSRINPEAPVPIVNVKSEFCRIGGAGNVASNIASLGGKAMLFSFVGKDEGAKKLKELLDEKRIEYFLDEDALTIEKTRIIGRNQPMLRFDKELVGEKRILLERAAEADLIIISDYAKGTITENLMNLLTHFKSKTIVDPKPKNKDLYKDVFLVNPNEKELFNMCPVSNVEEAGKILSQEINSHVLVKRSEKGMTLFSDKIVNIPTYAKEVYDVSGAGDSVIAALAMAIASGASIEKSAIIANYSAGISIEKKGVHAVRMDELRNRIFKTEEKIVSLKNLKNLIVNLKKKNKKIVWTNGCFDLIHVGHVGYLKKAKGFGNILVVGLDSDESVKKLKGEDRPVQPEMERAEILSAFDFVDYVVIFPYGGAKEYLMGLKPDVYVKGGDYNIDTINQEERKVVEDYGGEIKVVEDVSARSTSKIIKELRKTSV